MNRKGLLRMYFMLAMMAIAIPSVQSQTFSVVHNFSGSGDGANPLAGLVIDYSGNLYGTTSAGGSHGAGTVFEFSNAGVATVLYDFKGGKDGGTPESALLRLGGNLYGTTNAGGSHGAGTVFEVTPKGVESVLYSFTGKQDGGNPVAGLARDSAGNLYGTTYAGGTAGNGTVFKLVHPKTLGAAWTELVLYSFGTGSDGANPVAGVTFDKSGNLYGTTSAGGTYSYGTVFELSPSRSGWNETVLHEFALQSDGGTPYAGIVVDASGNLYGAATDGGGGGSSGGGTIFELTPASGGWTFNVIYSLPGWGISGSFRNLLLMGGKIYATTHCDGANTAGTIYELTPSGSTWTYTSLYVFTGGKDGLYSFSNLVLDRQGYFYGTTKQGGTNGDGVLFKIKP